MEQVWLWAQLAAAAGLILGAAHHMAKAVDHIAENTRLGRSFAGVVMLATATSLPELGTGVSSIALVEGTVGVDLAAGDAFGSNLFNLLIIGILDLVWRKGPILASVSRATLLVAVLGAGIISIAAGATLLYGPDTQTADWRVSPMSIGIICAFIASMHLIYRAEQGGTAAEGAASAERAGISKAVMVYLFTALIVVSAAVWLAKTGESIVHATGLEGGFVGTLFLALSTSLPELAASLAALRLGAPDLAITNVLGSNLFNMGFVLFLDDVALANGTLWAQISNTHALTGAVAVVMTGVVIAGLAGRRKQAEAPEAADEAAPRGVSVTPESALLIALYIAAFALMYVL